MFSACRTDEQWQLVQFCEIVKVRLRNRLCFHIDQPLVEVSVGILKSTVTVEDRMCIRIALDGLCKSVEHKLVVICIPNHKGNDTSVI